MYKHADYMGMKESDTENNLGDVIDCSDAVSISLVYDPTRPEDIDISHPFNPKRKDKKLVHVAKFVSRKTKFAILAAKKREENK